MSRPAAERIRLLLEYDVTTGIFRWRRRTNARREWNSRYAGKIAGYLNDRGYRYIHVDGRLHLAHRLAWLYVHGEWPPDEIDHQRGTQAGDGVDNLRPATHAENGKNQRFRKDNTSGIKGVSFCRSTGRWRASIRIAGKVTNLGRFDTKELAAGAYAEAAHEHHGQFARLA